MMFFKTLRWDEIAKGIGTYRGEVKGSSDYLMVELIKETVKKLQRKTKRLEGSGSSVSEQLLETLLQVRRDHLDQMRLICSIR